jgi:hypothetical protein
MNPTTTGAVAAVLVDVEPGGAPRRRLVAELDGNQLV